MKNVLKILLLTSSMAVFLGCQHIGPQTNETSPERLRPLVFAWPFMEPETMASRGGTTQGSAVTLATEPEPRWLALQEPDLSSFEKDRRAILAMAGDYRTSFQFTETAGFVAGYEPSRPYFSWATEHVLVLEDAGDFISLQHTLVMFFEDESGAVTGPMVMKHWRQDWTYQDTDLHTYRGNRTWKRQHLPEEEVRGTWSQAVYQVDDSPRYEVVGEWKHGNQYSSWTSGTSLRPLPRREYSVRNDYHILEGEHRITVVPTGWLHEQHNRKVERKDDSDTYLAQEIGVNRYERITEPDLSAADNSWEKTGPYWKLVRDTWNEVFKKHDRFQLKADYENRKLFEIHFSHAAEVEGSADFDTFAWKAKVEETIHNFLDFSPEESSTGSY